MRSVNVRFLRPGQVLADAVTNSSGAVLCPLGYQLTDKAIERLQNANVGSVWIEGSADNMPDVASMEATLNRRFEGVEDPILLRIKGLLQNRIDAIRAEYNA